MILELHLDPLVTVEPELACERGRQINELVLTADGDANGFAAEWPREPPQAAKSANAKETSR